MEVYYSYVIIDDTFISVAYDLQYIYSCVCSMKSRLFFTILNAYKIKLRKNLIITLTVNELSV